MQEMPQKSIDEDSVSNTEDGLREVSKRMRKVFKGQLEIQNNTVWFNDEHGVCRLRVTNVPEELIQHYTGLIDINIQAIIWNAIRMIKGD